MLRLACHRNKCWRKTIFVTGVLTVERGIHMHLGVKLHERGCVRDRNVAFELGIESDTCRPLRGFLVVCSHGLMGDHLAGFWWRLDGRRNEFHGAFGSRSL